MYEIDIAGVEFEEIFSDIKNRYLSTTNFPKFIIGTGLSITFNIPGMHGLANELDANFSKHRNSKYKETWEKCEPTVRRNGLEAALLTIPTQDNDFVERIREITGKFILEADYKVRENILKNKSAFEELLGYLVRSVSVNKKIIDVILISSLRKSIHDFSLGVWGRSHQVILSLAVKTGRLLLAGDMIF